MPLAQPIDVDLLEQYEPTEGDLEVAKQCLGPVPWTSSPVLHLGRILARYRQRLEGEWAARAVVGTGS